MNYTYGTVKLECLIAAEEAQKRCIESLREKFRMEVIPQVAQQVEIVLRRAQRELMEMEEELDRRQRVARRKDARMLKLEAKAKAE